MRVLGPGDNEEPGCVAIEPMDDARPIGIISTSSTERQELPRERPRALACARVHRQPSGLVHDEQVLVLEQHRNCHRLRLQAFRSPRELDLDQRPRLESMALRASNAVDEHSAFL